MSKDCGCFGPNKYYDFTIIDEMTPFNKDTFNKLKEEKIVVKEKEVTLNDVINYYYAFLNKNIWPIFVVPHRDHTDTYTIQDVFRSIQFYGPDYDKNRSDELKEVAKVVNDVFLTILSFYNISAPPDRLLGYIKNYIPNIEKMLKPDNSAQIAELTAIKQNLINKVNEIQTNANFQYNIIRGVKKNLEKELLEQENKQKRLENEFTSKRNKVEQEIANISNKINKLK